MIIVLIWATNNKEKYWNKILVDLVSKWHTVIPINPNESQIEGIKTYPNLWTIKQNFDIVNFVVKPEITLQILEKYKDLLINKKIWCQPWASDQNVENFFKTHNFKSFITDSCIMIKKVN